MALQIPSVSRNVTQECAWRVALGAGSPDTHIEPASGIAGTSKNSFTRHEPQKRVKETAALCDSLPVASGFKSDDSAL